MRRLILGAASIAALVAALAVGPFGAAAAAPYVYGCTPAMYTGGTTNHEALLSIYNGSASTANLIHKILNADGLILNQGGDDLAAYFVPRTSTVEATKTGHLHGTAMPAHRRITSSPLRCASSPTCPVCDAEPRPQPRQGLEAVRSARRSSRNEL